MSASITLRATDLTYLAEALEGFTRIRKNTGVSITPFAPAAISIDGGPSIEVSWDGAAEEYVIDESVGR